MKYFLTLTTLFTLLSCSEAIKHENAPVEDEMENPASDSDHPSEQVNRELVIENESDLIGFWVGDFEQSRNSQENKNIYADEALYWARENKINLSIDQLEEGKVTGHSVVAGNDRPFSGTYREQAGKFVFEVQEPGDDKYDGKFTFEISKGDSVVKGTWKAYKKIDIPEREYKLTKKVFTYNPEQMLEESRRYGDWNKSLKHKEKYEFEGEEIEDFIREFSSATDLIYKLNASNHLLTKEEVENLKKGDLYILRNTIYARHGYSFKNRPLRVFFDAQKWYIPVHSNIKSDFTEIEKKNIQLLLKYEKNAKEYYDTFGRG